MDAIILSFLPFILLILSGCICWIMDLKGVTKHSAYWSLGYLTGIIVSIITR